MTVLRPLHGFNPLNIAWGGPDEPRADQCSYCGDPFPDEDADPGFVPLILWNGDGWCAEFCDHCQARWFGLRAFDGPEDSAP